MLAAEAYGSDGNICADKNSCITLFLKSDPWLFEDGGLVPADRGMANLTQNCVIWTAIWCEKSIVL